MSKTFRLMSVGITALATPAFGKTRRLSGTEAGATQAEDSNSNDIVVTATRREALSDVPIAVSAVTAESLQNSGASDIASSTSSRRPCSSPRPARKPMVRPVSAASAPLVTIPASKARSRCSSMASIARARASASNELGEIERIEVLRGPARHAVRPQRVRRPHPHHLQESRASSSAAWASCTYGNYDFIRGQAAITGPITEQLAGRLEGVFVKRDGFYRDPANGTRVNDRDRYFVRGQLLFEPNDGS